MTKQTLIIAAIAAAALAVALYFAYGPGSSVPEPLKDTSILLYVEEGDVSYRLPATGTFAKATTSPVEIVNGTLVYTGLGKATILFPNNSSVALDDYTELSVTYEENRVSIFQTLGTTYHRVEALLTGSSYEVETPGTLAAVRGTKFAVKYNKKTKQTKVAVTEHMVKVSKWKETASSTKEFIESIDLEAGATVRVEDKPGATSSLTVISTSADVEMSAWVEENKTRDQREEKLKNELLPEEFRAELKNMLRMETEGADATEPEAAAAESEKARETETQERDTARTEQAKPAAQETAPAANTRGNEASGTQAGKPAPRPVSVTKVSEEVFFDKFSAMFLSYFYLDEKDTPCTMEASASERVEIVTSYAEESGYPFTSATLLSFAKEIETYCASKSAAAKVRLQGRFDAEYPYQENI